MATSRIEWTESTWNPLSGCSKVSPGCNNCYAERMAFRLKKMGQRNYRNGFKLTTHEHALEKPLKLKKPQKIFVNSMSDLFHKDVPFSFILKVFNIMREASWHTFQVLTKRSERLLELNDEIDWPFNVWMGASVENENYTFRIEHLKQTDAKIKFLSIEPLLGPLERLSLDNIDWVIVGGESGPGSRMVEEDWVRGVRDQSVKAKVPFFFKQWGGTNKKKTDGCLTGKYGMNSQITRNNKAKGNCFLMRGDVLSMWS
ncbi:MAG: DUF5131 family protein [Candidatus Anammoxibacter sp.]